MANSIARISGKASDFERRLIEDGAVTQAEHEAAIIAHLDCIRRAGISNVSESTSITEPITIKHA